MAQSEADIAIVNACKSRVDDCVSRTTPIRQQWKENFDTFVGGSKFENKAEWQSDFSVNEIASAIRTCTGGIRSNFLRRPDWFSVEGIGEEAKSRQSLLEKALRFQLRKANFRRNASTFLLMACTSMGAMRVGWLKERVKNPKLSFQQGDKETGRFNRAVASTVANPQSPVAIPTSDQEILAGFDEALTDFQSLATGSSAPQKSLPEFIQRSRLELTPLNPINLYWDPFCQYLENSSWKAYDEYVPLWKLHELEAEGKYKNVSEISANSADRSRLSQDSRFAKLQGGSKTINDNLVKVTEYFGTVVIDEKAKYVDWHVVYANDSVLLKSSTNPFWADGYDCPIVCAAAHEIPFRPTGAGIGDNAQALQRTLDSNYQLMTDQMRLGIVGINIINRTKFVDASGIQEGISPGKVYETLDDPDKVFKHINITSNIENQVFPMNEVLRQGIQKATGVSGLIQGAPSLRSRTSATEVSTQAQASDGHIYTISEDLEIQFLIPLLEKALARILQFGLDANDEEFLSTLDESERELLQTLTYEARFNSAGQYYQFSIQGFGSEVKRQDTIQRLNELLALYNTNGLVSQQLNGPALLRDLVDLMGFRDPSKYVIDNSELDAIFAENTLLAQNQHVEVSDNNNHQLHIPQHQKLMMSPNGNTPAMQAHLQEHIFKLQQLQALQAEAQSQRDNPSGLPPQRTTGAESRNEKVVQ